MSKELKDGLGPELLEEFREFQKEYPKMIDLLVTVVSAIGENAGNLESLATLLNHLEMSRLDHEWKLNTLKDLAMRQLHGGDPFVSVDNSEPTVH